MTWPTPSPQIQELIRRAVECLFRSPQDWGRAADDATFASPATAVIAADPILKEAMLRASRDNMLAWATANLRAPGRPVPPNVSDLQLDLTRDLVRRGLDAAALHAYRGGQNAAWQRWMGLCFEMTADVEELQELLAVSATSIATFVEETIAALAVRMDAERDQLTSGSQAERRDMVELILQGAPVSHGRAEAVLRHRLDGPHTAAVLWADTPASDLARLEQVAEAAMRAAGARQRLTVVASAATLWLWLPVATAPAREQLESVLRQNPDVRVAIGTPARGAEGFRRSHREAVEASRLMARVAAPVPLVTFEEVELVSLVEQDPLRATEFTREALGDFAQAPADLHETVRTYLRLLGNTSATAERLFTHRNTVIRRLARADRLLPRPLHEDPLRIAVALEVARWQPTPTDPNPSGFPALP
ncbi:PucR family transcriptional regulator [Streptomyces sp. A30]|uniref:PucR family transcriptional regulator n=1 Tax=Streptomyces sp. A30 TaxID=2789273 RepID=UPI0039810F72